TSALAPGRIFMTPMYRATEKGIINELVIPIGSGEVELTALPIFLVSALIIFLISMSLLVTGPVHCIALPNSTFGEVCMPGDNKRRALFRRHASMRRRAEISFLYENSGDWMSRWEIPLRWGALLLIPLLLAAASMVSIHSLANEIKTT
ncbi:hypothetical protein BVY04_00960, partial [bacterium M21]